MKIYFVVILLQIFTIDFVLCQSNNFSCLGIPESLTSNATAIVRTYNRSIIIKGEEYVIYKDRIAITVLKPSQEDHGSLYIPYDATTEIIGLKGSVFDKFGAIVSKIKSEDFGDMNARTRYSLHVDGRYKFYVPSYDHYPYTVEYEYEIKEKDFLVFCTWSPQLGYNVALENSLLTIETPVDYGYRIKEVNFEGVSDSVLQKNKLIRTWELKNLGANNYSNYSRSVETMLPIIKISPLRIRYKGIAGDWTSWKSIGEWINMHLLKDRDILPEKTIIDIKTLVKNFSSDKDKINAIYAYVQKKTRYVSIIKGSSGILPMRAMEVDQLGYGDCKALTNYTMALLKSVNIPSFYAHVYGKNIPEDLDPDFPCFQGNHVILCVPNNRDTIWLECTSSTLPAGELGTFTDNRYALICTAEGGKIVKTKTYGTEENRVTRKCSFQIDSVGNLSGEIIQIFQGIFLSDREEVIASSGEERKNTLRKLFNLDGLMIDNYVIDQTKEAEPITKEILKIRVPKYAVVKGPRIIIPTLFINDEMAPVTEPTFKSIFIRSNFVKESLIEYSVPEKYTMEVKSSKKEIQNDLGKYYFTCEAKGEKIVIQQKLKLQQGNYPPSQAPLLKQFILEVEKGKGHKIRLIKL